MTIINFKFKFKFESDFEREIFEELLNRWLIRFGDNWYAWIEATKMQVVEQETDRRMKDALIVCAEAGLRSRFSIDERSYHASLEHLRDAILLPHLSRC